MSGFVGTSDLMSCGLLIFVNEIPLKEEKLSLAEKDGKRICRRGRFPASEISWSLCLVSVVALSDDLSEYCRGESFGKFGEVGFPESILGKNFSPAQTLRRCSLRRTFIHTGWIVGYTKS